MNRSKIEWCDHTWNPITGCRHKCPYCYAHRMVMRFSGDIRMNIKNGDYTTEEANDGGRNLYVLDKPILNETGNLLVYPFGFEPTLHRYRMNTLDKLKMGNNVFVGAMADIFGEWVPDRWIDEVMHVCVEKEEHNFLFLTKNPKRYMQYGIPRNKNLWYGTTITRNADADRVLTMIIDANIFISIEPLHERLSDENIKAICGVTDWLIIGAETGKRIGKVVPHAEWIEAILEAADAEGIPVFMKESLVPIVGEIGMRRDLPQVLTKKTMSEKMQKKLFDSCACCGSEEMKKNMIAISAGVVRKTGSKTLCYMCRQCFTEFCTTMGIAVPDFEKNTRETKPEPKGGETP